VKLVQELVIGLIVGKVYLRAGFEGAVAMHPTLKLSVPWLLTFRRLSFLWEWCKQERNLWCLRV